MHEQPTILLLCVNYLHPDQTRQFCRHVLSLPHTPDQQVAIAVADNDGSLDGDSESRSVTVYTPSENLGYLNGCAFALDRWRQQFSSLPEWIGVVNTDIEFDHTFFTALHSQAFPDDVAIIAPDIRSPEGVALNPFLWNRPSRRRIYLYTIIFRSLLLTRIWETAHQIKVRPKRRVQAPASTADSMVDIYAPHGCAMFFHRRFFEHGGSLKYRAFLFKEEIHIAEQARSLGLRVVWAPALKLTHFEQVTLRHVDRQRRLRWEYDSARVIWEDYFA